MRIWFFGLALLLAACSQPLRVDFDKDPRILNGRWSGELVRRHPPFQSVSADPAGRWLIGLKDRALVWLDPQTGQELRRVGLPEGVASWRYARPVVDLDGDVWLPLGGRVLGWSADGVASPPWEISVEAFSEDRSHAVSREGPNQFTLWDVATRQSLRTFSLPADFALETSSDWRGWHAISPDLQLLAIGRERREGLAVWAEVRLYDLDGRKLRTLVWNRGIFDTDSFGVGEVRFSADSTRVVVNLYGTGLKVWRVADGVLEYTIRTPGTYRTLGEFGPEGKSLTLVTESAPPASGFTLHWWDSARGLYASRTVQDALDASAAVAGERFWVRVGEGTVAQFGPEGQAWRQPTVPPQRTPISFDLRATYKSQFEYTFTGTAEVGPKSYQVEGTGRPGAEMVRSACGCAPPPMLTFQALLRDAEANQRYLNGGAMLVRDPVAKDFAYSVRISDQPLSTSPPADTDGQPDAGTLRRE